MDRDDLCDIVDAAAIAMGVHLAAKVARGGLGEITAGDVAWSVALALLRSRLR